MNVSRGTPEQRPARLRPTPGERRWASVAGPSVVSMATLSLVPARAIDFLPG